MKVVGAITLDCESIMIGAHIFRVDLFYVLDISIPRYRYKYDITIEGRFQRGAVLTVQRNAPQPRQKRS